MKLEVIPAKKLSHDEFKALRRLTLGPNRGHMFDDLEFNRYDPKTKVVRLSDDNDTVLSWALVYPYDYRNNMDFQVYTRASHRRRGYGKIVYDKAVQVAGGRLSLIVHPHSLESTRYFNKVHCDPAGIPRFKELIK